MILLVEGMMCNHCKQTVENALSKVEGVSFVEVNLELKQVEVKGSALLETLISEIEDLGYDYLGVK